MNCLNFKTMLSETQRELVKSETPFVFKLAGITQASGNLSYWEKNEIFPNGIQRCFWVYEVDQNQSRGNHAHFSESQVIVAMAGVIRIHIQSIEGYEYDFVLKNPSVGLFLPPKHWIVTKFESGAVLLGMCNEAFSEADYIRDLESFKNLSK